MGYHNPVIPGFHPDPSVCRVGEDFYLVCSSFEYFPGVPVFHSRDLVNWEPIAHCLSRPSQLPLDKAWTSGGIYAPTIRFQGGRLWMITTNVSQGGHFVVSAGDPAEDWSEPVWCEGGGIDPSLCFECDEALMQYTSGGQDGGIMQARLDLYTGKHLEPARVVWSGTGAQGTEGPHLYKVDGTYYLLVAEGGTEYGHMISIARSYSPWGPFEPCPHNPILSHRSLSNPIQATGHGDLVEDQNGDWWLVFLGVRPVGYPPMYHLGRETFLAPVEWVDGWPVVNGGKPVTTEMPCAPSLPPHPFAIPAPRDDFDSTKLGLEWVFVRNPDPATWSMTERPGYLRLKGSEKTLGDPTTLAFVGRRQEHMSFSAEASLEFEPAQEGDEAGLCVRMNERHRTEVALTRRNGEKRAIVRRTVGSLSAVVHDEPIAKGPVVLRIEGEPLTYALIYRTESGEERRLEGVETRHHSTELAGGFTGVILGMYATGNGRPAAAPADFDYFEYRG